MSSLYNSPRPSRGVYGIYSYTSTSQTSCQRERAGLVRNYGRKGPIEDDGQEQKGHQYHIAVAPAKPVNPLHNMTVGELRVRCVAYPTHNA